MNIRLHYFPIWGRLFATTLTPATPEAGEDVQDDDPDAYRRDQRLAYQPLPNRRHQTHHVALELVSDDRRYRCFLRIYELADAEMPSTLVYEKELDGLRSRTLTVSSTEFEKTNTPINAVTIKIHVEPFKE